MRDVRDLPEGVGQETPTLTVSSNGAHPHPPAPDGVQPHPELPAHLTPKQARKLRHIRAKDAAQVQLLRQQCEKFYLSMLNDDREGQEQAPPRSLGFTGATGNEGRTTLALTTASILTNELGAPATLLECNWLHPCLHTHYGLPKTPGLAEWVRQECDVTDIRHEINSNLTIVLAGNGQRDAVSLLRRLRQMKLSELLLEPNEVLVVDLPPILSAPYGSLAAGLVDALVLVVRAGVTPDLDIARMCSELENMPIEGIILNQVQSRIPLWIQALL
jgi:protein-tyrosine kinase